MMVATKAPREEEMRNVTANVIPTAVGVPMEALHDTETEINMTSSIMHIVCSCMKVSHVITTAVGMLVGEATPETDNKLTHN